MQHHIIYDAQYKVLICKEHQCGITNVARHFQRYHPNMSTKTRLQIRVATQHLELANPKDIIIPSSKSLPIEGLELVKDGAKCNKCEYMAGTCNTMEEHCRNYHDWKAKDERVWTKQPVQTFYPGIIY